MLKDQNKEDSFFDSPAYSLTKGCLILSGGWPYLSPRKRKTIWLAVNTYVATAWFPELFHIIEIIDRTREVIYCSMAFLCTYLAFVLSINAALKSHSMRRLIDSLRENWNNLKSDDERKIFATYANYGRIFSIGLTFAYYMVLLSYIVLPLISPTLRYLDTGNWTRQEKNILEVEYYVIDLQEYYWTIFIHGSLACVGAVWLMLAYDVLFGTVVQHCCGMFAVLRYRIRQMNVMLYNYSYDRQLTLKKIEEIMMYHLACLEFAQKIEDFFCFQFIIQILTNTFVISVCGSQVIQLADTSLQESFRFLYLASATAFRLTFMNVFGQSVYDHSLRIHDHLIYTNWYEFPIQVRKLFIILYNRSAEPCNLTAAKMVNLNLDTYSKLMKTAMSYFMMIIQTL